MTATYQITEYSPTIAALTELENRYKDAVFDLSKATGMTSARKARAEIRTYRTSLEAMRKDIKAPALERCRLIDAEAKAITEKLLALEVPIDSQIKAEEARIDAEKEAKRKAEIARVAAINARISDIRMIPSKISRSATSLEITAIADQIAQKETRQDLFQEFVDEAAKAKTEALEALRDMAKQRGDEEEQAKERAKAAALAKAQAEQEAARLAAERAKIAAQQAALAAERAATKAKLAAERAEHERAINAERAAAEAKLAAERAEQDRLAEIERQRVAAERAALETEKAKISAQQAEKERVQRAAQEHAVIAETLSPIATEIESGNCSVIDGLVQAYRIGAQS